MVAVLGDVVEVLPLELACRCRVQQQVAHVAAVGRGHGGEAVQAPRDFRIAVPVDTHQAGSQQAACRLPNRDCTACADLPSSTDRAGPLRLRAPDSRLRQKISEIMRSMTGCDW